MSSACCHFICALICALPDKEIKQRAPPFNFGFVARVPNEEHTEKRPVRCGGGGAGKIINSENESTKRFCCRGRIVLCVTCLLSRPSANKIFSTCPRRAMNSSRDNARKGVLCAGGEGARAQNKLSHCGHRKKLRNQPERVVIGEKQQIEEAAASSVSSLDFLCGVAASCRPERASVLLAAGRKNDFYNPVSCLSLSLLLAGLLVLFMALVARRARRQIQGKINSHSPLLLVALGCKSTRASQTPERQGPQTPPIARAHTHYKNIFIYIRVCVCCVYSDSRIHIRPRPRPRSCLHSRGPFARANPIFRAAV